MPKCKIIAGTSFERELRRLTKRYPSIPKDVATLIPVLEEHPTSGTSIGGGLYKIRLAIKSKGKGKSGGARIITYFLPKDSELYLLSIYDKSEQGKITDKRINELLKEIAERATV